MWDQKCYWTQIKFGILRRFLKYRDYGDQMLMAAVRREDHLTARVWAEPSDTFHSWHCFDQDFPDVLMLKAIISCSSRSGSQLLACAGESTQQLGHICSSVPVVFTSHVEMPWTTVQKSGFSRRCGWDVLKGKETSLCPFTFCVRGFPTKWLPLILHLRNQSQVLEEGELV